MNTQRRRLDRLEALDRLRFPERGRVVDPADVLPPELIAYLNGDLTALPPDFLAGLDAWLLTQRPNNDWWRRERAKDGRP